MLCRFRKDTDENTEKKQAFERLDKMIRPILDLDEEKELAEYRDERYGGLFADTGEPTRAVK